MTAPRLTRRDLAEDVKALYEARRSHLLSAFHGTGDEDVLPLDGGAVRIVPVRGELELRRKLLDVRDDERVAFLVPWTVEVPIDLQDRFARNGRVQRIGRGVRVARMFGATEVGDGVESSPLADYVLAHHADDQFSAPAARLTVDTMWTAWLDRAWGLDSGGELALDVLLGWAALDARGPRFVETVAARGAAPVRDALLAHLEARLGPAGPLVWKAWEGDRGTAALELALIAGALGTAITESPVVGMWVRTTSRNVLGTEAGEALARLGSAAETALRYIERRGGADRVRRIVQAADVRADDEDLRPFLVGSTRLPSAWRTRLARLGDSLAAVAELPDEARAREAIARMRSLEGHELYRQPEQTTVVLRAEMAVRLACWLATRDETIFAPSATPYGDVELLASWFVREGGHLDRARRAVRGGSSDAFGRGVAAIASAVDEIRTTLDRRFARALVAWHEARRPETSVVPIDHAIHRIAAKFLDEDAARRLLIVLMDGMAWSQAVELLESMGQRASVWAPLAWHGMGANRIGDAPFPPVLTNFPTLTEVSRAACFAGKPMPPGPDVRTEDDPKRWAAHRDAVRFATAPDAPQLLLRGEAQTGDGSASQEALSRVADRGRRVVAVVINAIDMSLKSDVAHQLRWTMDTVKSLRDLLDAAAAAGRAVLLCSDHGHVPVDRLASCGPMQNGARWRTWKAPDDAIAEHEVGLRAGEGVWAPRGAHGVVLLADDAHRYGGGPGSGEHGGASLSEVVAPFMLLGNADVPAAADDRGQAVRPARIPAWWTFDLVGVPPSIEPAERRPRKPKTTPAQLTLETVAPAPSTTPKREPVLSPLADNDLLKARVPKSQVRERVLLAVEFLRARHGVADASALAAELGEFAARVNGLVSQLQEALNVDGYQVLRFDRQSLQVQLDLEMLQQQFDIKR